MGYVISSTYKNRNKTFEGNNMEAYCFKCRNKREISNAQQVTLKNGRPATRGTCPDCGTKVSRIGKSS